MNTEKKMFVDTPVEKIKPKEKKKKAQFKKEHKTPKTLQQKELKRPALIFWLSFAILLISVVIASAFLIGLAIIPWSIALYLLLGADIAAILILLCVLFVDVPDFPDVMAFVVSMFAWIAVNFIIGVAFLIWGLIINWIFGWMIGLILLGLALILLLIQFLIAFFENKKLEKNAAEQE